MNLTARRKLYLSLNVSRSRFELVTSRLPVERFTNSTTSDRQNISPVVASGCRGYFTRNIVLIYVPQPLFTISYMHIVNLVLFINLDKLTYFTGSTTHLLLQRTSRTLNAPTSWWQNKQHNLKCHYFENFQNNFNFCVFFLLF